MRRFAASVALLGVLAAGLDGVPPARAQELEAGSLLLIMDASGSMERVDDTGVRLLDGAKAALNRVVDELPDGTPVGLRVYGHRTPNTDPVAGCQDTELVVPVAPLDRERLRGAIAAYNASGYTPIGRSLQEAANDLPPEGPRTIVLVTDGEDTCGPPDPCQVARDLIGSGFDVRVETVGFFLQGNPTATQQLQCIADTTGGTFRTADNAAQLADELSQLSARALREFQAEGTAVEGGAAAVDAPVLEPGSYTDTILPEEASWYAIELEEGQELIATVTRAGVPGLVGGGPNNPYFEVFFADPLLNEANSASDQGYIRELSEMTVAQSVRINTGVVGVDGAPPFNSDDMRPGTYYVRVLQELNEPDTGIGEIPLEITFDVQGGASPSPSASASPSESASESPPQTASEPETTPSAEPSATAAPADEGGIPTTTIIIGLLAALVVLMGAGLVVLLRRG
jgi:hypothetical protein